MIFKIEKNDTTTHIYMFGLPVYYSKIKSGVKSTRILCFRHKQILPDFFIEQQNSINKLQRNVSDLMINYNPLKVKHMDCNTVKTSNKKLSVIVPVFNTEEYIERCINSIRRQSYKDLEIIIVDDCSTDNSLKIIERLSKKDPRIIVITNKENLGSGISRNRAILRSTGAYITFIDSDDYLSYDNFFADCLRKLKQSKVDCLITPYIRERSKQTKFDNFPKEGTVSGKEACSLYLSRKLGTHASCGKFMKSAVVKENKFIEYGFSQDVMFVSNTLTTCKKVELFKKYGYVYFNDNNSAWRPISLTPYHFYSSIRLLLETLNFQRKKQNEGTYINLVAFKRLWKKDHGTRIENFLEREEENSFVDGICNVLSGVKDEEIINLLPLKLQDKIKSPCINRHDLLTDKEVQFLDYIKIQKDVLNRLNSNKSVVIYISHLSTGGLERVASELSFILDSLGFRVNFLLDRVKNIDYSYAGNVYKADLKSENVLNILKEAQFIFDFKFKAIDKEFPLVKYIVNNYAFKYIPTIHNTATCENYFKKIHDYLGDENIESIYKILCVSEAVREAFTRLYGSHGNIQVIHNFIDTKKATLKSNADANVEFRNKDYYLFVGRLNQTEHKGIDILIEGFSKANIDESIQLVICGAGDVDTKVRELIENSPKKQNIKFLPFNENPFPLMRHAKALLAPSRWEGFSMVHLEALSVGTPVLSSKSGGALELIKDGENGFLFDVNDLKSFVEALELADRTNFDFEKIKLSVTKFNRSSYLKKINNLLR